MRGTRAAESACRGGPVARRRAKRAPGGTTLNPGAEAEDYYLLNDGTGHFTVHVLAPGVFSDSRSVAAGDLDHAAAVEIVLGNAGSEGYSNNLVLLAGTEDHPIQVFRSATTAPLAYTDQATSGFIPPGGERPWTSPLTQQVILVDVFRPFPAAPPLRWTPDGWLDGFLFSLAGPIYAGTNEIQRNVIAERLLKLPRD